VVTSPAACLAAGGEDIEQDQPVDLPDGLVLVDAELAADLSG